ncbi:MAG: dihydrodipicolinate synthase family protein [Planctomycetales bacterium]|nr:dihydrodipicolinate synthase family protein [Planctomycetales bacterium]MCA9226269.1 dihydrodipicolinate synthase family protein [Planctomycetales bacterium]
MTASTPLAQRLRTVQLVPITAFDSAGDLALEPMRRHFRRLFDAGIRVFIPCAGSAEFNSLSTDEIVQVIRMTREELGPEATIVAPIGQQLRGAISLGQRSFEAGADAVLVMPLEFPYLANEGARDYLQAILDSVGGPTLVYKKGPIPSDDLLLSLAEHPNMIGVKYAVNDLDAFQAVVTRDAGRIDWFCGSAERFAPYFALAGSPGYTSGAGNVCPRVTLKMHAALAAGDYAEALRWQRILLPIEHFRARAANSYNITFVKYAVGRTGLDFGQPRPPQRRMTDADMREADEILAPILAAERDLAEAS